MPTEQFKIGDIVQLKSGGPAMTVVNFDGIGWLICNWIDKSQKLQSHAFPPDAVIHAPDPGDFIAIA
jgi:uncharacterized protein YodC (DUF2158 family)